MTRIRGRPPRSMSVFNRGSTRVDATGFHAPATVAFLPSDVTSATLTAWYRSDGPLWQDSDRTTEASSDSDPVGAWDDKTANAYHLTQATAANKPSLKLSIVNSLPCIRFDGVNDFISKSFTELSHPFHQFFVIDQKSWVANSYLFDGGTVNRGVLSNQGGGTPTIRMYAGLGAPANGDLAVDTWGIVECLYNTTSSTLIVDAGTPATGNSGSSTLDGFTIGGQAGGGGGFNDLDVAEAIIYDGEVSGNDLTNLRNYLTSRYGL